MTSFRSYLAAQKRKYEEVDNGAMEIMLAQAQERSKHPRLLWDGCGFPEMDELELGLHLRGGAGNPVELQKRTYWLYTDMGRFIMDVDESFHAFCALIERLFQLETRGALACQIDFMPVLHTDSGAVLDTTKQTQYCNWEKPTRHGDHPRTYASYVSFVMNSKDTRRLRVRYNPNFPVPLPPTDFWEPQDNQHVVNLEVRGVGIAYWHLPSRPKAVNIRQDTFRNAIECLLPEHRQYCVQWSIKGTEGKPDKDGRLLLMAEAPSVALWDATQEALRSGDRVTITLMVVDNRNNDHEVRILMPGFNRTEWYNKGARHGMLPSNPDFFRAIRSYAQPRTVPDRYPLRIWAGVQHYENPDNLLDETKNRLSMILPVGPDCEADTNIWQSEYLAYTWDAVVVRPHFEFFVLVCMTNRTGKDLADGQYRNGVHSAEDGLLTLARFRNAVREISDGFNEEEEYIEIDQAGSHDTFLIGPGMTERQWHFQVFSWFDSATIHYRVHRNWPISECLLI